MSFQSESNLNFSLNFEVTIATVAEVTITWSHLSWLKVLLNELMWKYMHGKDKQWQFYNSLPQIFPHPWRHLDIQSRGRSQFHRVLDRQRERGEQEQEASFFFRILICTVSAFLLEHLISNDSYDGIYYIYLSPYHTCVTFKEVRTVVTFYKTHCDYWKISSFLHNIPFIRKFPKLSVKDILFKVAKWILSIALCVKQCIG